MFLGTMGLCLLRKFILRVILLSTYIHKIAIQKTIQQQSTVCYDFDYVLFHV